MAPKHRHGAGRSRIFSAANINKGGIMMQMTGEYDGRR
jgi:hypothetical protein